jgi:hypothetical protein
VNEYVRGIMNAQDTIFGDIARKHLIWYGHVDRMDPMRLPKIMVNWKPEGRKNNEVVPEEPGKMGYVQQ